MASIITGDIDNALTFCLRSQAAVHCRAVEDEARDVLRSALTREPVRAPPSFDETSFDE